MNSTSSIIIAISRALQGGYVLSKHDVQPKVNVQHFDET